MRSRFEQTKPPGLMLTSLLDMFTIILIFLIVSFEAKDYEFKLDPGLKLPESSANSVLKPAINLAITPDSLKIENEEIIKLDRGKFREQYYTKGEIPEVVERLRKAHEDVLAREAAGLLADDEDAAIVLIQADKSLDYKTLYLVMRSASVAGFDKYRLAIMKK
jgi:biopolymer transport protein ExbD